MFYTNEYMLYSINMKFSSKTTLLWKKIRIMIVAGGMAGQRRGLRKFS
jgi:hypothetical protein